MAELLATYKAQQTVERGFRFLKSPEFLTSSLYLKKPERIEALLMVMTCSLMIYAALEHRIRKGLVAQGRSVPDMKKKPTQKPTARWIFLCFGGITSTARGRTSPSDRHQHRSGDHHRRSRPSIPADLFMKRVRNVGFHFG